jgi:ribosomal protein L11 methyltransferase
MKAENQIVIPHENLLFSSFIFPLSYFPFMVPTNYYWLRVQSSPVYAELDQFRLMDMGALGTEEEEHTDVVIRACFAEEAALAEARAAFGDAALDGGEAPWEDWDRSWRDRQTPVEVTPGLTVCPPWVEAPHVEGRAAMHVIRLEAKMAFGTGSHESTRIAALLMEALDLSNKSVLDVGTGTGILALYAAQRGAAFSAGFDIDPVAGPCLRENLDLNPVAGRPAAFYIGTLDALAPSAAFDVLVINMIRTETWPYLDALLDRTLPGGRLVFSGQRIEDQPHWIQWFTEKNVTVESEITQGEWWGFTAKR